MHIQQSELPRSGGPEIPVRPAGGPSRRVARRRALDRLAKGVVTSGGLLVIGSIVAILFVIIMEMLPLFKSASVTPIASVVLQPAVAPLASGMDEYQEVLWTVAPDGVRFHSA